MEDKDKDAAKMPASASTTKTRHVAKGRWNTTDEIGTSDFGQASSSKIPSTNASSLQQWQGKESWDESSATGQASSPSQIPSTSSREERQRNDPVSKTGPSASVELPPEDKPRRRKGERKTTPSSVPVPAPEPVKDKWKITPTTKVEDLKGYSFPAEDDSFDPSRFKHPFTNFFNFTTKPLPIVPGPPRRSISELRELQRQDQERLEALAAGPPEEDEDGDFGYVKRYVAEMLKQVRDKSDKK